jgi:WD40 repeat protein
MVTQTLKPATEIPVAKAPLTCMALSTDGTMVAAGGPDGQVYVVRLSDKATLRTFHHNHPLQALAFDHAGKIVITLSDRRAHRWSLEDGHQTSSFLVGGRWGFLAPDGRSLATVHDAHVSAFDTRSSRMLTQEELGRRGLDRRITCGVFSPDGSMVVVGGLQRNMDAEDAVSYTPSPGSSAAPSSASSAAPDDASLTTAASGSPTASPLAFASPEALPTGAAWSACFAQLWPIYLSVGGSQHVPVFGNDGHVMNGVTVTPNAKLWVMVTSSDKVLWHVYAHHDEDNQPHEVETSAHGRLRRIAVDPAGKHIALLDDEGRIFDVPATQKSTAPALARLGEGCNDAVFTADSASVVTVSRDGVIRVFPVPK